jgi:hypothetical protein
VVVSFWSGIDFTEDDPDLLKGLSSLADYAHERGIGFGIYTLMAASRDAGENLNVVDPETREPGSKWGQSACLAGEWGDTFSSIMLGLIDGAGLDIIETDGPYHGDLCASSLHEHHRGLEDSQLRQWEACCDFYRECRKRGVYIDSPDWYYLNGSNKCGMGYRELNFSLPLWRQILISRQNIFDGTYDKTPSMGWMFVPLVKYRTSEGAMLEPLSSHIEEYEWYLAQNLGSGVQACYRGVRLYDSDETRDMVRKWVGFYKKHREILESDIIHVRRANGRGIDCMMHVNSRLRERALAMVYNPTKTEINSILKLPLYYTGLRESAWIREGDGRPKKYSVDESFSVELRLSMAPRGITYFTVEGSPVVG